MALKRKQPNWLLAAAKVSGIILGILFVLLIVVIVLGSSFSVENKVGVVSIRGELFVDGVDNFASYTPGVRETIKLLKLADEDPEIGVILLDINSGGGTIVASKELMRAVKKTNKPVVAYINEIGASGAYYAATAADEIVTDEDSFTGSIGAVTQIDNYVGLMKKIGVNVSLITSGEYKSMANPFDEFTPEERILLEAIVDEAYQQFRSDILINRPNMDVTKFDEVADGRLLSGRQALAHELIDFTGSRDFALERANVLAGIEGEPQEKHFVHESFSFTELFGEMGKAFGTGFIKGTTNGVALK